MSQRSLSSSGRARWVRRRTYANMRGRSRSGALGAALPISIHWPACGDRALLVPSGWRPSSVVGALSDDEILSVWQAADGLGSFGGLVQLALLTGMRRSELSGLSWDDIKVDRILLDARHTKTGAAHEIPLTGAMREVLSLQPRT